MLRICKVHCTYHMKIRFPCGWIYKSAINTNLQLDGSLYWTEVCSPEVTITSQIMIGCTNNFPVQNKREKYASPKAIFTTACLSSIFCHQHRKQSIFDRQYKQTPNISITRQVLKIT